MIELPNDAWIQLIWVIGALLTIIVFSLRIPGVARVFLLAQVVYWALSYVARPTMLLIVQPVPRYGDNLADPRLYVVGYELGIAEALKPVVFGLWIYAAIVCAYSVWVRSRDREWPDSTPAKEPSHIILQTLWVALALGLGARMAAFAAGLGTEAGQTESAFPVLDLLTLFASIGAIGLIVYYRSASTGMTLAVIGALAGVELVWSIATESKTPIMGAALAVIIRFAILGWSWRKVGVLTGIGVLGVVGFSWLQSFKVTPAARAEAQLLDASYPEGLRPFLSILRRFDLLEAATDVYYLHGERWLSPALYIRSALESMVPSQVIGEKLQSGTAWAQEVRGISVDMTQISVSLAEGNINEGYVIGGHMGVIVALLFSFALLVAASRALCSRNIVAIVTLGLTCIEFPILFERGVLGSMETVGKMLQLGIAFWVLKVCVKRYNDLRRKARPAPFNPANEPETVNLNPGLVLSVKE